MRAFISKLGFEKFASATTVPDDDAEADDDETVDAKKPSKNDVSATHVAPKTEQDHVSKR